MLDYLFATTAATMLVIVQGASSQAWDLANQFCSLMNAFLILGKDLSILRGSISPLLFAYHRRSSAVARTHRGAGFFLHDRVAPSLSLQRGGLYVGGRSLAPPFSQRRQGERYHRNSITPVGTS